MKHRSVIAFVIVAAALFAMPQLAHDLQALKGAAGARLHRELLHAFLSLPAGEPAAAAPVGRPAATLLASCGRQPSGAKGAKGARGEATGRAEGRDGGKDFERSAMIGDPANDPINHTALAANRKAADEAVAALPEVEVEAEVAMIIPPEYGIDPRAAAKAVASAGGARLDADRFRVEAEGLRVAYAAAGRLEAAGPEWQKAVEDAARRFDRSLPGAHELRVVRDGVKTKVLKFKCGECPAGAPRPPLPQLRVPVAAPLPAPSAPVEWASE